MSFLASTSPPHVSLCLSVCLTQFHCLLSFSALPQRPEVTCGISMVSLRGSQRLPLLSSVLPFCPWLPVPHVLTFSLLGSLGCVFALPGNVFLFFFFLHFRCFVARNGSLPVAHCTSSIMYNCASTTFSKQVIILSCDLEYHGGFNRTLYVTNYIIL